MINDFNVYLSAYVDNKTKRGTVVWTLMDGGRVVDGDCIIEAEQTSAKAYLNGLLDSIKTIIGLVITDDVCHLSVYFREETLQSYTDNIALSIAQCWKVVKEGGELNKHRRNADEKAQVVSAMTDLKGKVPGLFFRVCPKPTNHPIFEDHFTRMKREWNYENDQKKKEKREVECPGFT
jgi:hypothetical protein